METESFDLRIRQIDSKIKKLQDEINSWSKYLQKDLMERLQLEVDLKIATDSLNLRSSTIRDLMLKLDTEKRLRNRVISDEKIGPIAIRERGEIVL